MPRFILQGTDATTVSQHSNPKDLYHDLAISAPGTTGGTLTITGKKVGADSFESIPDGVIDLAAITSIQFTGGVESYQFAVSGFTGTGDITVTDISQRA